MSSGVQPSRAIESKTLERRIVWIVSIAAIVFSVVSFCLRVNERLYGQNRYLILCFGLFMVVFPFLMFLRRLQHSTSPWQKYATVEIVVQAIFCCSFSLIFRLLGGAPLAQFYGVGESGILSAYESIIVWFICFIALLIQRHFMLSDSLSREGNVIVGGCLGVIGVLMPKLLDSYEMLQAYCYDSSCGADNQLGIAQYEVAIASSASLATLFVAGVLAPTWKLWIFGLYADDDREHLDGGELQVAEEAKLQESSLSSSGIQQPPYRNSTPHPLLGAAVSGVVAGVCFSVVNRLFRRR